MNRFSKPDFKTRISSSFSISIIVFLAILVIFLYGISSISSSDVLNDKDILFDAVNRDVVHCYSIEGMYPPNVAYMENHYGLTYDKDKYIIDYEYIGSNVMPQINIIKKNGGAK